MLLKGIRRNCWSERCVDRMHGATVWLLRLSRTVFVAPVSLEHRRYVYYVRISRQCAVTSCIIVAIIGVLVFAGMSHDIYHAVKKTNQSLWVHSKSSVILYIPNYLLFCAMFTVGAFNGQSRMKRFVNYSKRIKKIHTNIEDESKPETLEKMLVFKLWVGVIASFITSIMKTVAGTNAIIQNGKSLIVQFCYTLIYLEPVVTCLLTMQVIFTITSVSWLFKSLNKSIRRLHDDFLTQVPGRKTRHNAAIVNNIHRFCKIYTSLIDLSKQVNEKEGRMIVILICTYTMRYFVCVYYTVTSCLFKEKISRSMIPANTAQNLSIMINIAMLVESCHTTHKEMKITSVLISQLLCCTESARDRVSEALTKFYNNSDLTEHVHVPLGVVEISRSFYSSLVGCLTSCFVIIYQFNLTD